MLVSVLAPRDEKVAVIDASRAPSEHLAGLARSHSTGIRASVDFRADTRPETLASLARRSYVRLFRPGRPRQPAGLPAAAAMLDEIPLRNVFGESVHPGTGPSGASRAQHR